MSNSALDNFFKQELTDAGFEYQEPLWQQLDQRLQQVRNRQPEKRRRAAVWIILLAALGGGAAYMALNRPAGKAQANTARHENKTPVTPQATTGAETADGQPPASAGVQQPGNNSYFSKDTSIGGESGTGNRDGETTHGIRNGETGVGNRSNTKPALAVNNPPKLVQNTSLYKDSSEGGETGSNNRDGETGAGNRNNTKSALANTTQPQPVKDANLFKDTANGGESGHGTRKGEMGTGNKKGETGTGNRLNYHLTLGANWSSPFSKPGVFGGVMLTKTIGDKRLFAGIKIAGNKLHHEFTSASKVNQTPVVTDAVIEKLTTIQIPFGYEFGLNGRGGKQPTTFLQAGFEPSFVTGVNTIFYDDNGVPGGPVTAVRNSPLLRQAINKFNVSFIAGFRTQLSSSIGVSLSGGYNLIDITDKQYYNRTTRNNNLRYLQAGLQWRIRK